MKRQKGMVFFRKKDADKDVVHYIDKNGSFVPITNVYDNIDKSFMREYIMKNAKHITSNYGSNKIGSELLNKGVADSVTWFSDNYFTEKKVLKYEFLHI